MISCNRAFNYFRKEATDGKSWWGKKDIGRLSCISKINKQKRFQKKKVLLDIKIDYTATMQK